MLFYPLNFSIMKTILFTTLTLLALVSCSTIDNKDSPNPQLPAVTQTGANTFGAIINGQVMVPRNSIGYIPPGSNHYAVQYYRSLNGDFEEIFAADKQTKMGAVYVFIYDIKNTNQNSTPLSIGDYQIHDSNGTLSYSTAENTCITLIYYGSNNQPKTYLSINGTGKITLLKNDNQIISGIFSCKFKAKDNPDDLIEITSGQFDFNRQTINITNFK